MDRQAGPGDTALLVSILVTGLFLLETNFCRKFFSYLLFQVGRFAVQKLNSEQTDNHFATHKTPWHLDLKPHWNTPIAPLKFPLSNKRKLLCVQHNVSWMQLMKSLNCDFARNDWSRILNCLTALVWDSPTGIPLRFKGRGTIKLPSVSQSWFS